LNNQKEEHTVFKSSVEAYKAIKEHAAKRTEKTVRDCSSLKVGDFARQGDIYVVLVGELEEPGAEVKNPQLVPGNTSGANHKVVFQPGLAVHPTKPTKLRAALEKALGAPIFDVQVGPGVKSKSPWTLTHPHHPDLVNIPGNAQIIYQIDAITRQRAED
jgi:hypothetical protein